MKKRSYITGILTFVLFIHGIAQERAIEVSLDYQGYKYVTGEEEDMYPAIGIAYKNLHAGRILIRAQFDFSNNTGKSQLLEQGLITGASSEVLPNRQECYAISSLWGLNFLNPESSSRLYLSTGLGLRSYRFRYLDDVQASNNIYLSSHRTDTTMAPLPFVPAELRYEYIASSRIGINLYAGYRFALTDRKNVLVHERLQNNNTVMELRSSMVDAPYAGLSLTYYFGKYQGDGTRPATTKPKGGYYEIWW